MLNYCEVCGHIGGHAYGCPEGPETKPLGYCSECGKAFDVDDIVYCIGDLQKKHYVCQDCCCEVQLEAPDPYEYEDYLSDKYERERHDV